MRLLAIGCLDIVLTLPVQAIGVFLDSKSSDPFIFYPGWNVVHAHWTPLQATRDEWRSSGWGTFTLYFTLWANVVMSFAIFGLFGFTPEALNVYRRGLSSVTRRFGRTPNASQNPVRSALVFRSGRTESGVNSVYVANYPSFFEMQINTENRDAIGEVHMQAYKKAEAGELPDTRVSGENPVEMAFKPR